MSASCIVDLNKKTIEFTGYHESKKILINFIFSGKEGKRINSKGVRFGYELYQENKQIAKQSWPVPGVAFNKIYSGLITSAEINTKIDTNYELVVWYTHKTYAKSRVIKFNSGKPFKAYDSMVWNKETEEWDMLKPYPEDATGPMFWDEEKLNWVVFDSETHV